MDTDLTFSFDTSFFKKGINEVEKKMQGFQATTTNVAKGINKGLTSVALKFGSVFAGVKLIKSALNNMPEVGEAFGVAKDIFTKNLLYPLRKEVFPYLQKMLDWVRDSRGLFIKWGSNLANIFRAVASGVGSLIKSAEKIVNRFGDMAHKIFGDRVKDINEVFDLISFKIAATVQYVSLLLGQVGGFFTGMFSNMGDVGDSLKGIVDNLGKFLEIFTKTNKEGNSFSGVLSSLGETFGKMANFVFKMTDKFLDGFVPALSGIMTPLQKISDALKGIFDSIFGSTKAMNGWGKLFESLGGILGTTIVKALETAANLIEIISKGIMAITAWMGKADWDKDTNKVGNLQGFLQRQWGGEGGIKQLLTDPGAWLNNLGKLMVPGGTGGSINDGIVRPDGSIVRTSPDDTIIATKNPVITPIEQSNNSRSSSFNINITPTIVLQQATESEGRSVAFGLVDEMQRQLNSEMIREGF